MTGEELQKILEANNVNQARLARLLNMSQQSVFAAVNRADIKSGFLERIAAVLKRDMSMFYGENCTAVINSVNLGNENTTGNIAVTPDKVLDMLDRQMQALHEQLNRKDEQISGLIQALNNR